MNTREDPADSVLIFQYLEGDRAVLPILVGRYHRLFCEKAYWVTRDKESAKDIAQESWMTVISQLHTLEKRDSFKYWALRIVYTKAIDTIKVSKKERENKIAIASSSDLDTSSISDMEDRHMKLLAAIRALPKDKQDIIRLFYTESYSIVEIAEFLNIPPGTVKSRLFKAREKLKKYLKMNTSEAKPPRNN